ncbi:NAD(P)/FAD-dependent oxidoreductase [Hymenobacter sp. BT188]|uniref:NAD(P)/FAD-dependent oxidoreductase n=1 Tax=Hymenobacter sp. BT188 TaxID=2763504 RepID=UPI001651ACC2|nr:NAD(P)/FAD-dependent oxidoreductase [Hymenobacter sp. BT188]MBC6608945.1 NAD(P)/FAD-dependent oxidoreductase [Hymenobacter sp. BT188]
MASSSVNSALQATYDVLIIGGSAAGLSAALMLRRSLRKVLVIDGGQPCNRYTPHSHGFMTRDGETPAQLLALAKAQAVAYSTVTFLASFVTNIAQNGSGFVVQTDERGAFFARRVLLATGVEDLMPPIEGFAECWGKSVLHCPYCHGYEVHSQPLGLLGNGDAGYELVRLTQNWSKDLTLFTNGLSTLSAEQQRQVQQLGIPLIESPISRIEHENGLMRAVYFQDGSRVPLTAMFARVPFRHHTNLAEQIGCEITATGLISVTEFGQTTVPGVFAAGDNSSPMRQITMASASGVKAGSWINRELIDEDLVAMLSTELKTETRPA